MSRIRLTDLAIRSLKADRQTLFIDSTTPNFGVRVSSGGAKSYVVVLPDRRFKTLGRWPHMSLKDARQAARFALVAPPAKVGTMALRASLDLWLKDCADRLRPSTVERYRYAARHFSGATVATTNTKSSDPHVVAALKVFLNWCVDQGLAETNPHARRKVRYTQRDRVLTDEEVKAIWQYEHPPYSDIVKMLILTGQRRAQFASFNLDWVVGDEIHFPPEVMKGRRAHILPLTPLMDELQRRLRPFSGWSKAKARIDTQTGVTGWVLHDARRYFSSTCARLGVPLHITEYLLDHRSTISGVQAIYNRYSFLPEMRNGLMAFQRHVEKNVL